MLKKKLLYLSVMKKKILLLFTIVIVNAVCLYGQQIWSLTDCIKWAKENNLQIQQGVLTTEQAKNNIINSMLNFAPTLNAGVSHNMSWGRSVNLQTLEIIKNKRSMSTSGSLSSSLSIFNGLSKIYTLKSDKAQHKISEQQIEKLKNDITIQITQAYLQILLSQEIEKSAIESYKSVEEQVERTSKLVDAGSQAYSTLLEVKAQLANEKSQCVIAKNNVRTNKLILIQLLDLPNHTTNIDDFQVASLEESLDEHPNLLPTEDINYIYGSALDLPQIKMQELTLEKSIYDYKSARGRYWPTLSIQAGYGSYYTDSQSGAFFSQFDNNKNPSVGLSLSIPIFNALSTRMSVRNQKLNIERERINLEIQKKNLYKEIQSAYNEAFSAYEKMKASKENLTSIQESFKYTENKFNVGMMNATDYNIAKANLFKAVSAYLQAKYQYIFEIKILDFYKRREIEL